MRMIKSSHLFIICIMIYNTCVQSRLPHKSLIAKINWDAKLVSCNKWVINLLHIRVFSFCVGVVRRIQSSMTEGYWKIFCVSHLIEFFYPKFCNIGNIGITGFITWKLLSIEPGISTIWLCCSSLWAIEACVTWEIKDLDMVMLYCLRLKVLSLRSKWFRNKIQFMDIPSRKSRIGISLNGAENSLNSLNSENLINHWSMIRINLTVFSVSCVSMAKW